MINYYKFSTPLAMLKKSFRLYLAPKNLKDLPCQAWHLATYNNLIMASTTKENQSLIKQNVNKRMKVQQLRT